MDRRVQWRAQPQDLECDNGRLQYPLQVALDSGNAELVLTLLKCGSKPLWHCDVSVKDFLTFAIEQNHKELLTWLMCYITDKQEEEKFVLVGHALLKAVMHRNVSLATLLINKGACPSRLHSGMLPLVAAAENGDNQMCDLLIGSGASLGVTEETSSFSVQPNPLTIAINTDYEKAVAYLISKGCDVNATVNWNAYDTLSKRCLLPQSSMLHFAVFKRNLDIAKLLVQGGSLLNMEDSEGNTPLHLACQDSSDTSSHMVQFLLIYSGFRNDNARRKGTDTSSGETVNMVNLNAKNRSGQTPLITAVLSNNLKTVDLLLQAKVDVNIKDIGQATALHHAVRTDSDEIVLHLVENTNCRINVTGAYGLTPLHAAVGNGNWIITDILLNGGANYQKKTHRGESLLHQSVRSKCENLVELFLDVGLDIDARTKCGETSLMLAARSDGEICELLIKRGAHLNIKDRNQEETALSQAVYFGCEENAQMLIREGADVNLCDKRNTAPLYWSIFNARFETLVLLVLAGAQLTYEQFEKEYPRNLTVKRNKVVSDWIRRYTRDVRQLQDFCRRSIRQTIATEAKGQGILDRIRKLMLPRRLKIYLSYQLNGELPHFKKTPPGD